MDGLSGESAPGESGLPGAPAGELRPAGDRTGSDGEAEAVRTSTNPLGETSGEAAKSKFSLLSLTLNLSFGGAKGSPGGEAQTPGASDKPDENRAGAATAQMPQPGVATGETSKTADRPATVATAPQSPGSTTTGLEPGGRLSVSPWGTPGSDPGDSRGQRFQAEARREVAGSNPNAQPLPPVLRDFQLRRSLGGGEIVDADGSTYGFVFPPTPEAVGVEAFGVQPAGDRTPQAVASEDQRTSEVVSFKAAGLHRSTRQWVVVDGLVLVDGESGATEDQIPTINPQPITHQPVHRQIEWWDRLTAGARLRGEVRLGSKLRFPLVALGTTNNPTGQIDVVGAKSADPALGVKRQR
jgi:hypothetical protein